MAAARKKSGAKKNSAAEKTKSKASSRQTALKEPMELSPNAKRILQFCLIVLSAGLAMITLLHLGKAGQFLFGLLSLVMGSFTWIFLPGVIGTGIYVIWKGGKEPLSIRFWIAVVLLMCSWCMMAALLQMPANDPWKVLSVLRQTTQMVLDGAASTSCGYIGAVLAGMFASLFANAGTWIMAVVFLILAVSLFGWEFWDQMMEAAKQSHLQRKEKQLQAKEQAALEPAKPEEETGSLQKQEEPKKKKLAGVLAFLRGDEEEMALEPAEPDLKKHPGFAMLEPEFSSEEKKAPKEENPKSASHILPVLSLSEDRKKKKKKKGTPGQQELFTLSGQEEPGISADMGRIVLDEKPAAPARTEKKKAEKEPEFSIPSFGAAETGAGSQDASESSQSRIRPGMLDGFVKETEALEKKETRKAAPARKEKKNSADFASPQTEKPAEPKAVQHAGDLQNYRIPSLKLLNPSIRKGRSGINASNARSEGQKLIQVLDQFGIPASLSEIHIGPTVTKFEITPGQGVRVNAITNLQNDIKMALAATDIRIEAPIPGKSAVGIEVPNAEKTVVSMSDLMRSIPPNLVNLPLVFTLGKDLMGQSVYGRLDTMPHLLIAGATGSGKSVCVNSIICSILMRTRPDEVKLMLVDPKKVEFTPYNGVPHLMAPVITDGDMANKALKVVVQMMDRRYDLFEEARVRNITAYNAYCDQNPDSHFIKMPRIVIIIDELADLMLVAAKEVEQSIQRITQLARAAGIHLIVATQRPSVNVITGVIKANIPSRIAFMVSSGTDSRTILDQTGAEKLLGNGDMLFLDNGETTPRRIQGVFIQDDEVNRITDYVRGQALPLYDDAFITLQNIADQTAVNEMAAGTADPLYEPIRNYVIAIQKASTSAIQRKFQVGYGKAARIIDALEANGVVGPPNGSKPREVLIKRPDDEEQY